MYINRHKITECRAYSNHFITHTQALSHIVHGKCHSQSQTETGQFTYQTLSAQITVGLRNTCTFAMALADNFECGCCNPYKIAKRLVKLILAIWMIGDMVMDGVTTKMYWDVADVCMNI